MPKRDFREALRQADDLLERRGMPPGVDLRLREKLEGARAAGREERRWRPYALASGFAAAAATVLAVALWPEPTPTPRPAEQLGGLTVLASSSDLEAQVGPDRLVRIERGACTLAEPVREMGLRIEAPAAVRNEPRGLRVVHGTVQVAVLPRRPGRDPARVLVSHGVLEVLGTRFTVVQRGDGGTVTLHEGAIRFVGDDGRVAQITPGESLSWPRPPPARALPAPTEDEPPPLDPVPARRRRPRVPEPVPSPTVAEEIQRVDALLERIAVLRSRGRYEEAVGELEQAMQGRLRSTTRERLSFEQGAILTYQMGATERACAHWRVHLLRFPQGRYAQEVREALAHLGCGETP